MALQSIWGMDRNGSNRTHLYGWNRLALTLGTQSVGIGESSGEQGERPLSLLEHAQTHPGC